MRSSRLLCASLVLLLCACEGENRACCAAEEPDTLAASSLLPDTPAPAPTPDSAQEIRSIYTPLDEAQCRVTEFDEESGSSTSRCPGVAGHALNVHDGDARVSIDIVTPDGHVHELKYWSVVTQAFSNVGPRAEWRMRGERPIALIVRVNASEYVETDGSNRRVSYLAIAKITAGEICVTDRIGPVPNANEAARQAADSSADRRCLPHVSEQAMQLRGPATRSAPAL
jgi:hypothetical protein